MASVFDRGFHVVAELTDKGSPPLSDAYDKKDVVTEDTSCGPRQGDEALKLVGMERQITFSDEYNLKLRKKLVRILQLQFLTSYLTGFVLGSVDSSSLRCSILCAFPVSLYCRLRSTGADTLVQG